MRGGVGSEFSFRKINNSYNHPPPTFSSAPEKPASPRRLSRLPAQTYHTHAHSQAEPHSPHLEARPNWDTKRLRRDVFRFQPLTSSVLQSGPLHPGVSTSLRQSPLHLIPQAPFSEPTPRTPGLWGGVASPATVQGLGWIHLRHQAHSR